MSDLFYSAIDLAAIVDGMELPVQQESKLFRKIWEEENSYLQPQYRNNYHRYSLDIRYWSRYFFEKPILDREFPAIQRDLLCLDHHADTQALVADFSQLDLFFKNIRLTLLLSDDRDYIRVKLRTLLKRYGYKRRSQKLLQHIQRCMSFYHLTATLKGNVPCEIETISVDDMLTFRLTSPSA